VEIVGEVADPAFWGGCPGAEAHALPGRRRHDRLILSMPQTTAPAALLAERMGEAELVEHAHAHVH